MLWVLVRILKLPVYTNNIKTRFKGLQIYIWNKIILINDMPLPHPRFKLITKKSVLLLINHIMGVVILIQSLNNLITWDILQSTTKLFMICSSQNIILKQTVPSFSLQSKDSQIWPSPQNMISFLELRIRLYQIQSRSKSINIRGNPLVEYDREVKHPTVNFLSH